MIIYEFLTWLIIQLGSIRHRYIKKFYGQRGFFGFVNRYDRDERNLIKNHRLSKHGFYLICCDCGLTHHLFLDENNWLHLIPERPKDYKYKWRPRWAK